MISRAVAAWLCLSIALGPARSFAADAAEAKARELFKQAQTDYDLGHFDKALELYSKAYELKPLPGFLFNIAQCHRKLGNWEQAAFFYGRFIDNSSPSVPNVEVARELLEESRRKQAEAAEAARAEQKRKEEEDARAQEELERRRKEEQVKLLKEEREHREAMARLNQPPPPAPAEPVTRKAWFWVVLVGGLAAVAGGTTAVVLATRPVPQPATRSETTLGEVHVQ